MNTLLQDLRYGVRMLLKNPGFAVIAVIALGLGIGANAAIFSVVNTVLLRPVPYADPDRLMVLKENQPPKFPEFTVSPGSFLDWQKQNTVFERLAAMSGSAFTLAGDGAEPERIIGARVSAGLFELLGVQPVHGRTFLEEEDQPGHETVVILSSGFWKRRFAGDMNVIGQRITLNGISNTVIGVMPPGFWFPEREIELWTPMAFTARDAQSRGGHYLSVIGRLNQSSTVEQARTEMSAIAERLAQQYPDTNTGWGVHVFPMQEYEVRDIRPALLVLLGAVGLVLLIACANVANLLLARATSRQKEIAIRTALGAGRGRIVRQLLTESILLALAGGAVGVLLANWGIDSLLSLAPEDLPRVKDVALDATVLGFTLLVTLFTGVIFGLVPAMQSSRVNLNETLKEGGRGTTGGHHRVRAGLVITEVALALVLLVGAGLLIRSFYRLQQVDPGFNPSNAVAATISLPGRKYPREQRAAFVTQVIEKISALPGVVAVGATQTLPIQGDFNLGFVIQGRPPYPLGQDPSTNYYAVTPEYFKAMGIPLLRGRVFTDQDREGAPRVAVINEEMAKRYFPDEDPIGKRIHVTQGPETFREIVGIVGDVKQHGLAQPTTMQTYEPFFQMPFPTLTLVVRAEGNLAPMGAAIRGQVLGVDKEQPVSRIRPLEQVVSGSVAKQRFSMLLLGIFAAVALVLAAVGLYGVMSYSVTQRTHEIGIRTALGASRTDVLKLVVGQGMILALTGVGIGLVAAFALTRLMSVLLFGVSATDPLTFVAIPAILTAVALAACFIPARRATKVDPMIALRYE